MSSNSHTRATTFLLIIMTRCGVRTSPIVRSNTIAELTAIVIGGLDQWVMIRGVDGFNPILCPQQRADKKVCRDSLGSAGSRPMWEELWDYDLFRDVPSIEIPVWFVVVENVYNTPAILVKECLRFINAPE